MGKNHIENSLKHFLKKKVKITLGLVVAFMITGTVGFAADSTTTVGEHNKPFEEAIKNLAGLGINSLEFNNKTVEDIVISNIKDNSGDNTITIKSPNFEKEIKIQDKYLTENTKKVFENVISNLTTKVTTNEANENPINSLVLLNEREHGKILYNKGVIISRGIYSTQITNAGAKDTTLQNDGILISSSNGQYLYNTTNSKSFNNGIIISKSSGQMAGTTNSEMVNNGLIITETSGQNGNGAENVNLLNKGVIAVNSTSSAASGQSSNNINTGKTEIKNYGLIDSNVFGQRLVTMVTDKPNTELSGKAENFGIIFAKTGQEAYGKNMSVYNYGLITTSSGAAISGSTGGTGFNYGVVKVDSANKAFSKDVTNKGIVIADSGTLDSKYDTGILLHRQNGDYVLANTENVKVFGTNEIVENFGDKNTFGDFTKGFVKDTTVKIDNTDGKVIGAVVTDSSLLDTKVTVKDKNGADKEVGAILDYAKKDDATEKNGLFLKDTTVTGYFEDDGVLLNVGNKNLTLGGETNITAVKNDMELDVYAVNIEKGGAITVLGDKAHINGLINGEDDTTITFTSSKGSHSVNGDKVVVNIADGGKGYENYFAETLNGGTNGGKVNEIEISTENAVENLTNRLTIEDGLTIGTDDSYDKDVIYDTNDGSDADHNNTDAELEITVNNIHNIKGNVSLGVGKDTFIVTNNDNHTDEHLNTEIDLGAGDDKFVVVGNAVDDKGESKNIFSYNVVNAETIELRGGTWGDWNDAKGTIKFTDSTKTGKQPNLLLGNSTTMNITLGTGNQGSDFAKYVAEDLKLSHAVITGTGNGSAIKYLINEETGLDMTKLTSYKYSFDKEKVEVKSAIFNVDTSKGNSTTVTVKTAEEMGLSGEDRIIYHAYLNQIKAGNANAQVIGQINSYNSSEEFAKLIRQTSVTGEAYYTAGSTLTKDITNSYLSSVEDFTKRAGKGEWLAQGKYINSDTEFDGGKKVKGYDGDITGTVGMIEYGVTENTSYGAVFGMGDAEMNIQGGGKLDGDNTYIGAYMKHRTQNGIELVGNIGYMKSEMDSVLRNDFNFNNNTADQNHPVNTNGKTFEDGTANSSAVVIGLKGRKDYRISDSVKLQPTLGARLTFINQEEAENPEMHFTIVEQDIIVVEGTAGMGIAKEFALSEGKFELNTGFEYTFAAANSNNDARYKVFDKEHPLEDVEAAENTGKIYFGADYEHENGVGFNGKYEMMWSDKGDDSRITAGVSYRF